MDSKISCEDVDGLKAQVERLRRALRPFTSEADIAKLQPVAAEFAEAVDYARQVLADTDIVR